ncbi:MAG: acyl-CoA dehydrogenase [bacterium]
MAEVNFYKSDLREIEFSLFEQFKLTDLFASPPYDHFSEDDARMILKEAYTFATEVVGPTMGVSDRKGAEWTPDGVKAPEEFQGLWKQYYENGWNTLNLPESLGGQGAPHLFSVAVSEMMTGANTAFNMYPGLSMTAAAVIRAVGSPEQKELFPPKIESGDWGGTMVLTEPNAGTDVGLSLTKAAPNDDGSYSITGNKIFITGGDHDLAENIIHLALARIEGAAKGTRGLSLFIIPKFRVNPDGSLGEPNDVVCTKLEHKMGIHASATAALAFGENGNCHGYLLGGDGGNDGKGQDPGEGMRKMFLFMNVARLAVGVQSLAVASTAYLNALAYARTRLQGSHITRGRGEKGAVPIIEHPDVRRMLLEMKSIVEGCRMLTMSTVQNSDQARILRKAGKDEEAQELEDYYSLLLPLVKAHISDMALHVTSTGLQVFGGAGYTNDFPAEQYMRDARIFPIYEGTNGIQALDLVGRKLGQNKGALIERFGEEVHQAVKAVEAHEGYQTEAANLGAALEKFNAALGKFLQLSMNDGMEQVALGATAFLDAMSRIAIAKLLLEAALIAEKGLAKAEPDSQDAQFYQGKIASARYYARHLLPVGTTELETILTDDSSPLDIPDGGFSLAF